MSRKELWKIRFVKEYAEAGNHLFIGQVLEERSKYVKAKGTTYHFGKMVLSLKDIKKGSTGIKLIPWNRIEVIDLIDPDFNLSRAEVKKADEGIFVLSDEKYFCELYGTQSPKN